MKEWTKEDLEKEQEEFKIRWNLEEKLRNDPIIKERLNQANFDIQGDIEFDIWRAVDNYLDGWDLGGSTNDLYEYMWKILYKEGAR